MNTAASILIISALSTAIFHTLIPDHWLPFVLIGRARNWSVQRTALISGVSALLHISLSLVLGLVGIGIGLGTSMAVGEALEKVSGVLLILLGIFYAYWSFRKGGHFHIGGKRVHHHHDAEEGKLHTENGDNDLGHWDADRDIIDGQVKRSDWYLAFIIGLNPCVLIFPILFAAAPHGIAVITAITVLYSVTTCFLMVGLTIVGLLWAQNIKMEFFAKYGEILSGLFISLIGVFFLLVE